MIQICPMRSVRNRSPYLLLLGRAVTYGNAFNVGMREMPILSAFLRTACAACRGFDLCCKYILYFGISQWGRPPASEVTRLRIPTSVILQFSGRLLELHVEGFPASSESRDFVRSCVMSAGAARPGGAAAVTLCGRGGGVCGVAGALVGAPAAASAAETAAAAPAAAATADTGVTVVVHGGAWAIPDAEAPACLRGVARAALVAVRGRAPGLECPAARFVRLLCHEYVLYLCACVRVVRA